MLKFLFQCNTCGCKEGMVRSWNNKLIAECNYCHDFEYIADTEKVNTTLNLEIYTVVEEAPQFGGERVNSIIAGHYLYEKDAQQLVEKIQSTNSEQDEDELHRIVSIRKREVRGDFTLTKSFAELCLLGQETPDRIDDYIDKWHESDESETRSLHEFLGMTDEEYGIWIHNPAYFETVLEFRSKA